MSSRRTPLALASLLALGALLLTAAPALAAPSRAFDSQISGLIEPTAITVDSGDNLWISDAHRRAGFALISKYAPYPSQTKVDQRTGEDVPGGFSGCCVFSLALNDTTESLYVADSGPVVVDILDSTGAYSGQLTPGFAGRGYVYVAVDNSTGPTTGRIYAAAAYGPSSVRLFDANGNPLDFSASASYLSGSEITGTPNGAFSFLSGVAVDNTGTIYVIDEENGRGNDVIDEFAPNGTFIQTITGAGVPGGFSSNLTGIAVDPTNGNVLVGDAGNGAVDEFDPGGTYIDQLTGTSSSEPFGSLQGAIGVNSKGYLYVADDYADEEGVVDIFKPSDLLLPLATTGGVSGLSRTSVTLEGHVDPHGAAATTGCVFEYVASADFNTNAADPYAAGPSAASAPCSPAAPYSSPVDLAADLSDLTAGTTYHYRVAASNALGTGHGRDQTFTTPPAVTELKTDPATELTQESALLNGSFTGEAGLGTEYFFEYGTSANYGHKEPVPPDVFPGSIAPTETHSVNTAVANLVPNTTYHYRIIAANEYGTTDGEDREFITYQPPTIEGVSSTHVTPTSADLEAAINPQGVPSGVKAECRFEYGTTTAYGTTVPCPEPLEGTSGQHVAVSIQNLQSGVTYHFRLLASSRWGTVTSEDQTFEFFPASCPNSAVRQQTGSAYLPDCRAYELVSPSDAKGTLLFPGGPNTGQATSPSRFSFVGQFNALPGADPMGTGGDLYVATRTDTGWVSHYIGLPGSEGGCMGGPPEEPWSTIATSPVKIQDQVPTDPGMNRFLDFLEGPPLFCFSDGNGTGDSTRPIAPASNAPYEWSANGSFLGRLPTGFSALPEAAAAFKCPFPLERIGLRGKCASAVAVSADLNHFFFSSRTLSFSESQQSPGLTVAPGSAYDDNLATGEITLISKLPGGADIPQDPLYATLPPEPQAVVPLPGGGEEFIRFPAVSTDGSHVLMSTATAPTPNCNNESAPCQRFTDTALHLYISIDHAPATPIAEGHSVDYVGMTPDGTHVYFTSEEHLTNEDLGHGGASLFMWSEEGQREGHPITLISKANPGSSAQAGNTADCNPALTTHYNTAEGIIEEFPWTTGCGILPYSGWAYANTAAGRGGNAVSDSAIAANGDIYFYSPEQLDGDRGILGQQNLYDYREGRLHFVAAFAPGSTCAPFHFGNAEPGLGGMLCSAGPIARLEISPDDTHMAFITADRITSYDNTDVQGSCQNNAQGLPTGETQCTEMYSYTPATGAIVCDSCNPSGRPPTSNVYASQDGLFMTNDGRTFFSTADPLVPQDTNHGIDVYEFLDGRPQLITPGTGTASATGINLVGINLTPGLVGVSANGTDVYFSTYDSLISEDHNGNFLKFYDARTNGGFPQPPPSHPCAAAEECHGPGTEAPTPFAQGTAANLTGGNLTHAVKHKGKKHRKRARHKRHRPGVSRGGGK